VILLLWAIVLAFIIGYATGGRLRNLEHVRLRAWPLAVGGLALQLIPFPGSWPDRIAIAVLLLSFAMLVVFALLNIRFHGVPVILFGLLLNALVISLNSGMPVTREALENSGQEDLVTYLIEHGGAKHHLATDDDVLLFLGDVIGIPPPIGQAISVGDIFVYAGMIWALAFAMRARSAASEPALPPEGDPPPDRPGPDPDAPPPTESRATNRGSPPTT
jgi:hypothetical protein